MESAPRTVAVDRYTVHARGDDLDDLLPTMAAAARPMPGDPRTDPASARGLVAGAAGTGQAGRDHQHRRRRPARATAARSPPAWGSAPGVWVDGYGVHLNSMIGEGELVRELVAARAADGLDDVPAGRAGRARPAGRDRRGGRAAAGSARRWCSACCGCCAARTRRPPSTQPRLNALPDLVRLEPGFSPEVVAALEADGAGRGGRPPRPLLRRRVRAQPARRRGRSAPQRLRDHGLTRLRSATR